MNLTIVTPPVLEPMISEPCSKKRERASGIYQILCKPTGKIYIGSAINIDRRKGQHFSDLMKAKHRNSKLQRAWNKYGQGSFVFSILEVCDEKLLIEREQYYLDSLWLSNKENRFNIVPVAGSNLGMIHSEETRKKISDAKIGTKLNFTHEQIDKYRQNMIGNKFALGYRHTDEAKRKISEAGQGRLFTKESCLKISNSLKGIKHFGRKCSEETKLKISIANKGNKGRTGQPLTLEARARLSMMHKGKKHTEEHTNKMAATSAFFSADQCEEIRLLYGSGDYTFQLLANKYGCTHSTIGNVIHRTGRAYR